MVADHRKTKGISLAEYLQQIQLSQVKELILAKSDRGRSDAKGLCHHSGPKRGNAEAKEGRNRLTQSHAEGQRAMMQLAEEAELLVSGLSRA